MKRFLLAALCAVLLPAAAQAHDFIVLGDIPYSDSDETAIETAIAPAIEASDAAFVVHYGDLKKSKSPCSDALIRTRRDAIYALKPGRVFYSPGDNDWTDCDRPSTTDPMPELERLDFLRKQFFEPPPDMDPSLGAVRQKEFPENARWTSDGAVFATIHVVGTNNGRAQILLDPKKKALALVAARDAANKTWIETAAAEAKSAGAKALVFIAQADVTEPWGSGPCTEATEDSCDAFHALRDQLKTAAKSFGGPTLYIHGDTSPYCLDKGFGGQTAPNLWRLNGSGDYAVIDAVGITLTGDAQAPFDIELLVGKKPPTDGC